MKQLRTMTLLLCAMTVLLASCMMPCAHEGRQETQAVAPTCTAAGNSAYWSCPTCGMYFRDSQCKNVIAQDSWILPASHTLTQHLGTAKSCTSGGNSTYWDCSVCDKFFSDHQANIEIAADSWILPQGHVLAYYVPIAKTCTKDGRIENWACSACGKYFSDHTAKSEILPEDLVVPASHNLTHYDAIGKSCTTNGRREYSACSDCNKYFSGFNEITSGSWLIPASHDLTKTAAIAATCTTGGNSAYWTCTTCGKYFNDMLGNYQVEQGSWNISAAGHTIVELQARAKSCVVDGNIYHWTCTTCNDHFGDRSGTRKLDEATWNIPAGHELTVHAATTETLQSDGNTEYQECTACSKFFSDAGITEITQGSWIIPGGYTITFNANQQVGSVSNMPAHRNVLQGNTLAIPTEVPTYHDSTFIGWYSDMACTTAFDFGTPITAETTLYARWAADTAVLDNVVYTLKKGTLPYTYEITGLASTETTTLTLLPQVDGIDVTSIASQAFKRDKSFPYHTLTGDLTIPYTVTYIGSLAFQESNSFTTLVFEDTQEHPSRLQTIGEGAFDNCTQLAGTLRIPASVTTIEPWAFSYTKKLTSVVFVGNRPSIGENAFANSGISL